MSKKVLVISTSLRKGGNSDALAEEFAKGARYAGHRVEVVSLEGKTIGFCKGCLTCQKTKRCIMHDDGEIIARQMLEADVIAFATPIYFYEMCGQMKTLLDRTNPLFTTDYQFRDIYLLTAAADGSESSMDGAIKGLDGWVGCFSKANRKGVVFGLGLTNQGDAFKNQEIMKKAYEMGVRV